MKRCTDIIPSEGVGRAAGRAIYIRVAITDIATGGDPKKDLYLYTFDAYLYGSTLVGLDVRILLVEVA